jgi:hypothetical protein
MECLVAITEEGKSESWEVDADMLMRRNVRAPLEPGNPCI